MSGTGTYTIKAVGDIKDVDATDWNACANPGLANPDCGIPIDPFTS